MKLSTKTSLTLLTFTFLSIFSCTTKNTPNQEIIQEPVTPVTIEEKTEEIKPEEPKEEFVIQEPIKEEVTPVIEEPIIEEKPVIEKKEEVVQELETDVVTEEPEVIVNIEPEPEPVDEALQEEYKRSINENTTIDLNTFNEDKKKILAIIADLDTIMQNMDYEKWLPYIEKASINYWENPTNLKKASNMLPGKVKIQLKNLNHYFKYIFVPSRKNSHVDEMRYISDTNIKAVQVTEEKDIVYYYFKKIDGQWMLHLPPLDN